MITYIKWLGTASYITGMVLTSFNVYPLNLLFGGIGGLAWFITGVYWRDKALSIVEFASAAIYFSGLAVFLIKRW